MLPSNGWANRSSIERMASPTSRPKRQRNPSTTLITVESSLITVESSRSSAGFARAFLFLGGGFGGGRRGPLRVLTPYPARRDRARAGRSAAAAPGYG